MEAVYLCVYVNVYGAVGEPDAGHKQREPGAKGGVGAERPVEREGPAVAVLGGFLLLRTEGL